MRETNVPGNKRRCSAPITRSTWDATEIPEPVGTCDIGGKNNCEKVVSGSEDHRSSRHLVDSDCTQTVPWQYQSLNDALPMDDGTVRRRIRLPGTPPPFFATSLSDGTEASATQTIFGVKCFLTLRKNTTLGSPWKTELFLPSLLGLIRSWLWSKGRKCQYNFKRQQAGPGHCPGRIHLD